MQELIKLLTVLRQCELNIDNKEHELFQPKEVAEFLNQYNRVIEYITSKTDSFIDVDRLNHILYKKQTFWESVVSPINVKENQCKENYNNLFSFLINGGKGIKNRGNIKYFKDFDSKFYSHINPLFFNKDLCLKINEFITKFPNIDFKGNYDDVKYELNDQCLQFKFENFTYTITKSRITVHLTDRYSFDVDKYRFLHNEDFINHTKRVLCELWSFKEFYYWLGNKFKVEENWSSLRNLLKLKNMIFRLDTVFLNKSMLYDLAYFYIQNMVMEGSDEFVESFIDNIKLGDDYVKSVS